MPELRDGQTAEVQGSGAKPYVLKNTGGVYSCSCPAWRNQSAPINRRTCKHLKLYLGSTGNPVTPVPVSGGVQFNSSITPPVNLTTAPAKLTSRQKAKIAGFMLAGKWNCEMDPQGWFLSEKLDGLRAKWDGTKFSTKEGNEYYAPAWFTADLPNIPLDGELWCGRRQFQKTMSIVRSFDAGDRWKEVKYVLFDAPAQGGPVEDRFNFLKEAGRGLQYGVVLDHRVCTGIADLQAELGRVVALGAEGLMIQEPGSLYTIGESSSILKVKQFHDAEAVVVEHTPGKGKYKGMLGAVWCVLPDGTKFKVGGGFSDAQRRSPPPIGSTITYRFTELTDGGVPKCASFVRLFVGS